MAGIPTVTIACSGFVKQAHVIGQASGFPKLRVAEYPGHIGVHELPTRLQNYQEVLLPQIIKLLTEPVAEKGIETIAEPKPEDIVFRGSFEAVNEFFHRNLWSDGLPIVPPTLEKIGE